MKVYDIEVHGFNRAMRGLARSYNQNVKHMPEVALKLSSKDLGHNKFLESIVVWMEIEAPRFFWSEFDTYRGDIDDTKIRITKQSDSTMHTLKRQSLTQENFEYPIIPAYLKALNTLIEEDRPIELIKNNLPEGFIQGRSICMNFKVLRNIILQRYDHKLPQWKYFCKEVFCNLPYFQHLGIPESIVETFL